MPRRSFWAMSSREAFVHAAMVAAALWSLAAVMLLRPGPRDLFGTLKGADFVHFYTLGHLALHRDAATLYDAAPQYVEQVRLVPASAGDHFVPIYPPQTALLFAPFAAWPYGWAVLAWALLTAATYAAVVSGASAPWRGHAIGKWAIVAAAAAFPPFWNLMLGGQTTVVPLAAFALAGAALARDRRFSAGLALGLLAIKPQFAIVVTVLAVVCREWRMIGGAALSLAIQAVATVLVLGTGVWSEFAAMLRRLPDLAPLLEPRPYQLHSIGAVTRLLPAPVGAIVWAVCALAVVAVAIRVWRSSAPAAARFGVVVLASVLVDPHVTIYDATVLVWPLLAIGAWLESRANAPERVRFWALVYWLTAAFLFPTAWLVRVQLSVVILVIIFWQAARLMARATESPTAHPGDSPTIQGRPAGGP